MICELTRLQPPNAHGRGKGERMYSNSFRIIRPKQLGESLRANGLHCTERFAKETLCATIPKASIRMYRRHFVAFERLLSACRSWIKRESIHRDLVEHEIEQVQRIIDKKSPEIEHWIMEREEVDLLPYQFVLFNPDS